VNARDTLRNIARPVPASLVSERSLDGRRIHYLRWYDAADLMDERAPSWTYTCQVGTAAGAVYVVARVTVPTDEGPITREAIGNESDQVDSYGDPFSNAESMALRRAFAKLGLGRELYQGAGVQLRREAIAREAAPIDDQTPPPGFQPLTVAEIREHADSRRLTHTITVAPGRNGNGHRKS
jgi:hypothetical protein